MANNPRAKQFMPFASLKGYFDLIREEQRIKEPKKSLSEEGATVLSFKLNQVKKGMLVKIIIGSLIIAGSTAIVNAVISITDNRFLINLTLIFY